MSQLFVEYGLFLLKTITVVLAIIVVIAFAAAAGRRAIQDNLEVENLNRRYRSLARVLRKAVLGKADRRKEGRAARKQDRQDEKSSSSRPRSFVLDGQDVNLTASIPTLPRPPRMKLTGPIIRIR